MINYFKVNFNKQSQKFTSSYHYTYTFAICIKFDIGGIQCFEQEFIACADPIGKKNMKLEMISLGSIRLNC